ncbi:hypothetical protein [Streptomyces violascens]|uniref:Secreted protein n=1 Tax=Streptomyces violascens TaxID=67381 RepID=A0ABQ3QV71_9ACTN|nr:hypothetical protein [Streptomyces violascens]GHI41186.1 hypothetical protein Sviol_55940 [Streptomyces violascens]
MERKQLVIIAATVFAWSVVMAALGQAAAIATAAPALGLTVQQVILAVRAHNASASGHRVVPVPDEEGAP